LNLIIFGKKVKESTSKTINVETLAKGIYMVEAISGEMKMVEKFIKN